MTLGTFPCRKDFLNWVLPSRNGSETYKFKGRNYWINYCINILLLIAHTCEQWLFSSVYYYAAKESSRCQTFWIFQTWWSTEKSKACFSNACVIVLSDFFSFILISSTYRNWRMNTKLYFLTEVQSLARMDSACTSELNGPYEEKFDFQRVQQAMKTYCNFQNSKLLFVTETKLQKLFVLNATF